MKYNIYSVRDINAEYFLIPFFARNDAEAQRIFGMGCKQPNSMVAEFPSQFELFKIGEWNESEGTIVPCDRVYLCNGLDFAGKDDNE